MSVSQSVDLGSIHLSNHTEDLRNGSQVSCLMFGAKRMVRRKSQKVRLVFPWEKHFPDTSTIRSRTGDGIEQPIRRGASS